MISAVHIAMPKTKSVSRVKRATNGIKVQPIPKYRNRVLTRRQPTRHAVQSNAPAAVIELSSDDDEEYHPPDVVPHPARPIWYGDDLMITAEGKKDSPQLSDVLPLLHSSSGVRYEKRKELSTAVSRIFCHTYDLLTRAGYYRKQDQRVPRP